MFREALVQTWIGLRASLIEQFPELADDPETLVTTLDGITGAADLVERLLNDAEEDKALAAGLKDHITALTRRKERISDRAAKRKAAALTLMQELGLKKLARPAFTATVAAGPQGTRIVDEAALPAWAWRKPPPVLDTQTIRARLLAGEAVPGAVLGNAEPYLAIRT